jgi:two-component system, cell cycle sensor histidine kinase and response regulator CckA
MPTILAVDDERMVLEAVSEALQGEGYWVLAANGARTALAACEADVNIDLLITDIQMPGMDGRQLAKHFSRKYPRSAVLYMTGYFVRPTSASPDDLLDGHPVLVKPFLPETLADLVRKLLHTGVQAAKLSHSG